VTAVVTRVILDLKRDGTVGVEWQIDGECDSVDIACGATPETVDHAHVMTMPAAPGRAVLEGTHHRPLFVSVTPSGSGGAAVAGARNLGLAGLNNFRDLGGYRTRSGQTVRWGLVFRSDALLLDEDGFKDFSGLGVRAVYDLRSDQERETTPNRLPTGEFLVQHLSLVGEESARAAIEAGLTDGEAFLADLYVAMLERSAGLIGTVISGLADENLLPAVFHCAAGKDRTGIVAAVLLLALGVDEDVVLDDYELTSRYRNPDRVKEVMARLEAEQSISPEAVAGILRTPRWAMGAAIKEIENRYGGIAGYLTGPAGVAAERVTHLRRLLLTP
jgi:protein-tyrosine phosphatase